MSNELQGAECAQSDTLAGDRLVGAPALGKFWGLQRKEARHLIARGPLPVAKLGGQFIASKRVLAAHYERLTKQSAQEQV